MIQKLPVLVCFLMAATCVLAQTDSAVTKKRSCSCAFGSINTVGIVTGGPGSYFQFQTINGLRYKTWFAGIGLGFDAYPTSGIPVFLDVRKDILRRMNTPFVYVDGGVHVADFHNQKDLWQITEYNNGLYYDAGVGYKVGLPKRGGVLVSVGYSYKEVEKRLSYPITICDFGACPPRPDRYKYSLNRLSIKAGWQF